MKQRVKRAFPHQNGKVLGLLMAATSLIIVVPMFLLVQLVGPGVDAQGNPIDVPAFVVLVIPVVYLVFGYIGGALSSFVYNLIAGFSGGFHFEFEAVE